MDCSERPKFLMELLAEVDQFDAELFKPKAPVSAETEDKVIGVLSPWLRQLWAYKTYMNRQMKLTAVDREYESAEQAAEDPELAVMAYQAKLLEDILWLAVRMEHNLAAAKSVGVRVDWQVVTSNPKPTPEEKFRNFMRGFDLEK